MWWVDGRQIVVISGSQMVQMVMTIKECVLAASLLVFGRCRQARPGGMGSAASSRRTFVVGRPRGMLTVPNERMQVALKE
jgi:hypothetical protein